MLIYRKIKNMCTVILCETTIDYRLGFWEFVSSVNLMIRKYEKLDNNLKFNSVLLND